MNQDDFGTHGNEWEMELYYREKEKRRRQVFLFRVKQFTLDSGILLSYLPLT